LDLATFLAAAVALLILASGYFLFNGLPVPDKEPRPRHVTRRP
jgi:hypothetical protein